MTSPLLVHVALSLVLSVETDYQSTAVVIYCMQAVGNWDCCGFDFVCAQREAAVRTLGRHVKIVSAGVGLNCLDVKKSAFDVDGKDLASAVMMSGTFPSPGSNT